MIYSNSTEYAIRALSELVLLSPPDAIGRGRFVLLDRLASEAQVPREFVAKIFRQLVERGILSSAKGPGGGFALARPSHQISLADIAQAIDTCPRSDRCVVGLARCNDTVPCPQHDLFKPIRQRLNSYLSTTTLADTAASLREKRTKFPQSMIMEK